MRLPASLATLRRRGRMRPAKGAASLIVLSVAAAASLVACADTQGAARDAAGRVAQIEQVLRLPVPQAPSPPATADSPVAEAPLTRPAPLFTLPSAQGPEISLASYAGDKNVVVVFYRAFW